MPAEFRGREKAVRWRHYGGGLQCENSSFCFAVAFVILLTFNATSGVDPTVSQQGQLPEWSAQIVSRFRAGVELAEHFVHCVDDRLRLFQLNRVT